MPSDTIEHQVGTAHIDGKPYQLVRTGTGRAWGKEYRDEPPWSNQAPPMISDPILTWHLGGLKSRSGIPGTSEYGQNTDGRRPFRLTPSPKINTVTLTNSAVSPTSVAEALGYIWYCCGRYVYRIDPSDDSVVESKDFGEGNEVSVMCLRWETDILLVTTNKATNSIWRVTAIGTPDTWTQQSSGTFYPYRIAAGINRLFAVDKAGLLRNISTGLDAIDGSLYADAVQSGNTDTAPNSIVSFERTTLVGKPEGLFGVDTDGFGINVIRRLAYHADNCLGMYNREPRVLVPHSQGLYDYIPGTIRDVGLEREVMDESPLAGGIFNAFTSHGHWIYGSVPQGSNTYILVGREGRGSEPRMSPIIWDTLIYFAATCKALHTSTLTDPHQVWFGHGNDAGYFKVTGEYATTANRFTPQLRFDDWRDKDFNKVTAIGRELSSTIYWDLYYSVDGGTFLTLDVDGNAMRVNSNGLSEFFLPTTAKGREVQWRFDYTSNAAGTQGELNMVEPFAIPRPKQIPVIVLTLRLAGDLLLEDQIDRRTAIDQFNDLAALKEVATAVASEGPWGTPTVHLVGIRPQEVIQQAEMEPELLVEVLLMERETS